MHPFPCQNNSKSKGFQGEIVNKKFEKKKQLTIWTKQQIKQTTVLDDQKGLKAKPL